MRERHLKPVHGARREDSFKCLRFVRTGGTDLQRQERSARERGSRFQPEVDLADGARVQRPDVPRQRAADLCRSNRAVDEHEIVRQVKADLHAVLWRSGPVPINQDHLKGFIRHSTGRLDRDCKIERMVEIGGNDSIVRIFDRGIIDRMH